MGKRFRTKKVVEENVYELAKQRVSRIFDLFDEVVVSFSGGKDSTVVLELCLEEAEKRDRLPLRVVFYDEEALPLQTIEYVRRRAQDPRINLEWYCIPLSAGNACSFEEMVWYPWDPRCPEKWVRPLPEEAITTHPLVDDVPLENRPSWADIGPYLVQGNGSTGLALGVRADESLARFRQVSMRETDNYIVNMIPGVTKVLPIYDFTTQDVWTAPALFGWDYNRAYDVMEMLGIKPSDQRVAPPYGTEPMRALWMFREGFPEIWDKMVKRVPGANTGAMYGMSVLYGYGEKIEKPDGVTWADFVHSLAANLKEPLKSDGITSINAIINAHYGKTHLPIMANNPHPDGGITWRAIAKIALTGDHKGRKQQMVVKYFPKTEPEKRAKALAKYLAEIDEVEKAGKMHEYLVPGRGNGKAK